MTSECPPRHTAYASEALARNAVTLHGIAFPNCPGYHAWPHDDHWHVGHRKTSGGRACKDDPEHRAVGARLRRHRPAWLP